MVKHKSFKIMKKERDKEKCCKRKKEIEVRLMKKLNRQIQMPKLRMMALNKNNK